MGGWMINTYMWRSFTVEKNLREMPVCLALRLTLQDIYPNWKVIQVHVKLILWNSMVSLQAFQLVGLNADW